MVLFSNTKFSLFGLVANLEKYTQLQTLPEDLSTWGPCCCYSWSTPPSSPTRKAWKASGWCSPSPTRTSFPQGLASPGPPFHSSLSSYSSSLFSTRQPLSLPFHPSHRLVWGVFDPPPSLGSSRSAGQGGTGAASCHREPDYSAASRWKAQEEEEEEEETKKSRRGRKMEGKRKERNRK